MASGNKVKKNASTLNSKWLQNALKSLGVTGMEIIKDIAPATSDTISSAARLASDTAREIRGSNRSTGKYIINAIKNNPLIKIGEETFKNALSDLKSGKLYNQDRGYGLGDDLSSSLDDFSTSFDDLDDYLTDDGNNNNINIENNVVNEQTGDNGATLKAIQQQSKYQIESSKATVDTMVAISSTMMLKNAEISRQVLSELSTINQNLAAIVEYNNSNMTKFIEASIGYYTQMGSKQQSDDSSSTKPVTSDDIFTSDGGIDFSKYKDYIKHRITQEKEGSIINTLYQMVTGMGKDMITGNPIGTILKMGMKAIVPKVVKESIKALDDTVKNFIPQMLEKLGSLDETYFGSGSTIIRTISRVFGIKPINAKTKFNTTKIEKGPIPYNGVANHTIVEIIPKYLRESNTYLRMIAESITGKSNEEMSKSFVGFDWVKGKFTDIKKIRADTYDQILNSYTNIFQNSNVGEKLASNGQLLSPDKQEEYLSALNQLYVAMGRHEGNLDLSDSTHMEEVMAGVISNPEIKNLIQASLQQLLESGDNLIGNLYSTRRRAIKGRNDSIKYLEQNMLDNGIFQIQSAESIDDYIDAKLRNNSSPNAIVSGSINSGRVSMSSIPSLIQGIQDTLNRGIKVRLVRKLDDTASSQEEPAPTIENTNPDDSIRSVDDFRNLLSSQNGDNTDHTTDALNDNRPRIGERASNKINMLSNLLNGILSGNPDVAWNTFMLSVKSAFKKAGTFLSENFLSPMKKTLFGEKDENGYRQGGIIKGFTNKMNESFFSFRKLITGKGYVDSNGNTVADATEDEMKNTVVGKVKSVLKGLGDGIKEKIFGKKDETDGDENDPNGKKSVIQKAKGGIAKALGSFMSGLNGWKEALFGKEPERVDANGNVIQESGEEKGRRIWNDLKEKTKKYLPSAIVGHLTGSLVGGATGGVLSWLIGGPVGGAVIGTAVGIASQSDKFKDWMFGKLDEETKERTGGVISKKMQDYMKKNGKYLGAGAAIGVLTGGGIFAKTKTFGLLSEIVGGPIVSAAIGIGTSMLFRSETWQKFLYGDPKAGQLGLVNTIKKVFGNFGKNANGDVSSKKLFGMATVGMTGGAITAHLLANSGFLGLSLGPWGPIGGAVLGLGASILAQKKNFKEWLFGTKDEDGNKKEGILGKFKNMLIAQVFTPIKNTMLDIGDDFRSFFKYKILYRINNILEPIANGFAKGFHRLISMAPEKVNEFSDYIKENLLSGFVEKAGKVLGTITNGLRVLSKGIYTAGKSLLSLPFSILSAITSPITRAVGSIISGVTTAVGAVVKYAVVKPIKWLVIKPLGFAVDMALKVINAPFKLISKFVEVITPGLTRIGNFMSIVTDKISEKFSEKIIDPMKNWLFKKGQQIKDTVKVIFRPVTEFVKEAITFVKNYFHNVFSGITTMLWKGIKAIFGIGKNKNDDQQGGGFFRRAWQQADPRTYQPRDYSDVDPNDISNGKRRKISKKYYNAELQNNKMKSKDRKAHEYNQKLIQKWTGGQRVLDTEENRQMAILMAQAKGHSILSKFKNVEAIETPEIKEKKRQAEIAKRQAEAQITVAKDTLTTAKENAKSTAGIFNLLRAVFSKSTKYADFKAEKSRNKDAVSEARKGLKVAKKNLKDINHTDVISDSAKKQVDYILNSSEDNIPQHASGTSSAKKGPAVVGENGPEVIYDSHNAKLVGLDGPEVVNMSGGETVIPNNKIGTQGMNISQFSEYSDEKLLNVSENSKLSVLERILKELIKLGISVKNLKASGNSLLDNIYEDYNVDEQSDDDSNTDYNTKNIDIIKNKFSSSARKLVNYIPGVRLARTVGNMAKNTIDNGKIAVGAVGEVASIVSDKLTNLSGEKSKKDAALADATQLSAQNVLAKKAIDKEQESDNNREEAQLKVLQDIREGQSKHSISWDSIFSKKGLITTGLLLLAPLAIKLISKLFNIDWGNFIPNLVSAIGNGIKNMASDLAFIFKSGGLGNGDSSADKISDEINGVSNVVTDLKNGQVVDATNDYLYDENGNITNETGARSKLLGKITAKGTAATVGVIEKAKLLKTAVKSGADDSVKAGLSMKSAKLGSKTLVSTGKNMVTSNTKKLFGIATKETVEAVSEKTVAETTEKAMQAGAKVAQEATEATSKGIMSTVMTHIKNFLSKITSKIGEKTGKVLTSVGDTWIGKITKAFKNNKVVKWITAKVGALLGVTAGLASTGIGLLAKEATWVVLGALNGATGAKRLFRTDDVDATMIVISTAFGALTGTTVGSIVDIVNEVIASVTGLDILSELASIIYGALCGQEKAEALRAGQESFQEKYITSTDEELKKQYATMIEAGLLDPSITEEEYLSGARKGDYAATYKSFADYNDEQHQTLASRIGNGIKSGWNRIKNGAKSITNSLFGSTDTYYTDSNGNQYRKNDNGTYQVTNSDGRDLGYISEDALPSDAKESVIKNKGFVSKVGDTIVDAVNGVGNLYIDSWNTIKNWFTGGSGSGTQSTPSAFKTDISTSTQHTIGSVSSMLGGKGNNEESSYNNGMKYYSQNDTRWANNKFIRSDGKDDGATMSNSGCGPTAMSMVVSELRNKDVSPVELAKFAQISGTRDSTGVNSNFISSAAYNYGLDSRQNIQPTPQYIEKSLSNGNPMILLGTDDGSGKSPYTTAGHYVVATGVDSSGNVSINDPRGKSYSKKIKSTELASSTGMTWEFNRSTDHAVDYGFGGRGSFKPVSIKKVLGGRGVSSNKVKIIQKYAVNNNCYKTGAKLNIKGLMLHSVGCSQPSGSIFATKFNTAKPNGGDVCVHAFIDANNGDVYQILPWDMRAWHCGTAYTGGPSANDTHIGIEMCEPSSSAIKYISGSTFKVLDISLALKQIATAYKSAVLLFARLCQEYGLNPLADGVIISHAEGNRRGVASAHADCDHLWQQTGSGYTMDKFRQDVYMAMKQNINVDNTNGSSLGSVSASLSDSNTLYNSTSSSNDANSVMSNIAISAMKELIGVDFGNSTSSSTTSSSYNNTTNVSSNGVLLDGITNVGKTVSSSLSGSGDINSFYNNYSKKHGGRGYANTDMSNNASTTMSNIATMAMKELIGVDFGGTAAPNASSPQIIENTSPTNSSSNTNTTNTSSSTNLGTSSTKYATYVLNDEQKNKISDIITGETGGSDIVAARQEASQMANLNEVTYGRDSSGLSLYKTATGGWYAAARYTNGRTSVSDQAVNDVLINGKRTLPRYVTEHDMFPLDAAINGHWNNGRTGEDRSQYKRHVTQIKQNDSRGLHATYTFYDFFGKNRDGDVSGYYPKDYEKYKNDQPYGGSGAGPTIQNKKYAYVNNDAFANTNIEPLQSDIIKQIKSSNLDINNTTTNIISNDNIEKLMNKMIEILENISENSGNLPLLKDIKSKVGVNYITTNNNVTTENIKPNNSNTVNTTKRTNITIGEKIARRIAFGQ